MPHQNGFHYGFKLIPVLESTDFSIYTVNPEKRMTGSSEYCQSSCS